MTWVCKYDTPLKIVTKKKRSWGMPSSHSLTSQIIELRGTQVAATPTHCHDGADPCHQPNLKFHKTLKPIQPLVSSILFHTSVESETLELRVCFSQIEYSDWLFVSCMNGSNLVSKLNTISGAAQDSLATLQLLSCGFKASVGVRKWVRPRVKTSHSSSLDESTVQNSTDSEDKPYNLISALMKSEWSTHLHFFALFQHGFAQKPPTTSHSVLVVIVAATIARVMAYAHVLSHHI